MHGLDSSAGKPFIFTILNKTVETSCCYLRPGYPGTAEEQQGKQ